MIHTISFSVPSTTNNWVKICLELVCQEEANWKYLVVFKNEWEKRPSSGSNKS